MTNWGSYYSDKRRPILSLWNTARFVWKKFGTIFEALESERTIFILGQSLGEF